MNSTSYDFSSHGKKRVSEFPKLVIYELLQVLQTSNQVAKLTQPLQSTIFSAIQEIEKGFLSLLKLFSIG
ncbi:conserved hypothetical protein [Vibrio crassostreae]|nr:conserved hypothetical protein [Vibrio crassostreae]CAK3591157.1 conserved hypothetical protein [Vibrio crassostreae]